MGYFDIGNFTFTYSLALMNNENVVLGYNAFLNTFEGRNNVMLGFKGVMNAQYFIDKFTAIPDDKWITGQLCNSQGHCCVLGHCGDRRGIYEDTPESHAIKKLFHENDLRLTDINDYSTALFKQGTPKDRILAALEYIRSYE